MPFTSPPLAKPSEQPWEHPYSNHTYYKCTYVCRFFGRNASHLTKDCNIKENIKQEFIENKIKRFGIGAEQVSKSLITDDGIQYISDEQFEDLLKEPTVRTNSNDDFESYHMNIRQQKQ